MTMHFTGKGGYCLQRQFAALAIREVFILEEEAVQSHQGRKWKISKLIFSQDDDLCVWSSVPRWQSTGLLD